MTGTSLVGSRGVTGVVVASMERRRNPPNTVGGFQYSEVNVTDDVAITGPNSAEDVPVGAIQSSDKYSIASYSSQSEDQSTVDDTIEGAGGLLSLAPWRQNDFVWRHNIHAPFSPLELWQGSHNQ